MTGYAKGTRVELVHTSDEYTDLRPGALGTFQGTNPTPWGDQLMVDWDSGSNLMMLPDDGDRIRPHPCV